MSSNGGDGAHTQLSNQARAKNQAKVNEALASNAIDEITKQEIRKGWESKASWQDINAMIDGAMAGTGKYGARLKNQKTLLQIQDQPGLSQVVLAAGKAPLGDPAMTGNPSLIPQATQSASLILEAQKAQQKAKG